MRRAEVEKYVKTSHDAMLTANSPQAEQPAWITTPLRPHQRTLLAAARSLESKSVFPTALAESQQLITHYGVIADRVGSGKSLVALSLVKDPPPQFETAHFRNGGTNGSCQTVCLSRMPAVKSYCQPELDGLPPADFFKAITNPDSKDKNLYVNTALLIAPHNICSQWETYCKTQTQLNVVIIRKSKDCDYDRPNFFQSLMKADLIVLSNTMMRQFSMALHWNGPGIRYWIWSRLFIDEADSIGMKQAICELNARFKWYITASWCNMLFPNGIRSSEFHLVESIKDLLPAGMTYIAGITGYRQYIDEIINHGTNPLFGTLILRNTDEWINTSLHQPVIYHNTIMCAAPANLAILEGFITPAAMEALHAGDTAGAISLLGLKTTGKESLVERVLADIKADIDKAQHNYGLKQNMTFSSAYAKAQSLKKANEHIVQLRQRLKDLEERVAGFQTDNCPICYDVKQAPTIVPCCKHSFCLACLCNCLKIKKECPLCRTNLPNINDLLILGPGSESATSAEEPASTTADVGPQHPAKGAALLSLIMVADPSRRFLVFSAHEASFKGLHDVLQMRGIRSELLKGSNNRIDKLRKEFTDGKIRVLCLNARYAGAGLNLDMATDVVLYHRMNMELEKQVIGRAVRFERTADLQVHHLVHDQETIHTGFADSNVIVHV